MEQTPGKAIRETVAASLLALAGLYAFFHAFVEISGSTIPAREFLLALVFLSAIIVADRYPIHLLRGTKLALVNLPIFLSTALLAAPLSIGVTGVGLFIANLLARKQRGLFFRDIAATSGQWMWTVFLGHELLHWGQFVTPLHFSRLGFLLVCAFLFIIIDFTVFSVEQASIYDEPFFTTLKSVFRHGFSLEVIQYLIAILGVLAARQDLGSLLLLVVPILVTYVAFKNIKETRYETIQVLNDMADTVDLRDTYTGGHSKHVTDLVQQMLVQLKISGPEATLIEISARLHDIGKLGIPDQILLKPGKLTVEEMAVMQTHAQKGGELIEKYKDFSRGAAMIKHHHERWDGHGYPSGLKGYEIPFGARVIAVADSFEAMTSDRPYRKALSVDQAIEILLEGRGKQWDPTIVNVFVDLVLIQLGEKSTLDPCSEQADPVSARKVWHPSQETSTL